MISCVIYEWSLSGVGKKKDLLFFLPSLPIDHSQTVHGLDTLKELACDLCEKTFATPSALYIHGENEHKHAEGSPIFLCKICSRPFKTKNLLTRHLAVVHTNNRPYPCDQCDLKFKSSTNLKVILDFYFVQSHLLDFLKVI